MSAGANPAAYAVDGRALPGDVYRHYKGGRYVVVCEATEEATLRPLVVYRNADGRAWTRPVEDFFSTVQGADGEQVARFTRVADGG